MLEHLILKVKPRAYNLSPKELIEKDSAVHSATLKT